MNIDDEDISFFLNRIFVGWLMWPDLVDVVQLKTIMYQLWTTQLPKWYNIAVVWWLR